MENSFFFSFFVVTQGQKSRQNQGGSGNAGMEKTDPFHLSFPHVVIINGFQVLVSSITCLPSYLMLLLLSHFSRVQLCDPIDSSPPGCLVPGILQARTLEWVAISFSNAWKWKVKVKSVSHVWPSATPWTAAFQAPPSMGFSRQEYWSGVPLPSPLLPHREKVFVLLFPSPNIRASSNQQMTRKTPIPLRVPWL